MHTAHRIILLCVSSILALFAVLPISRLQASDLRCGFASAEITPPVGYRMSGYFYERFSTGVANPLRTKVVAFEQGDTRAIWVFCDLIGVPFQLTSIIRDDISKQHDVPRENIFIGATHTHTGPLYFGPLRNHFHKTAIEKHGKDEHETVDYSALLRERIVQTAANAISDLKPTSIATTTTRQDGLAFNRRYVMKDGSVRTNPGKSNPDVVRPAGPVDPQVGIIQFAQSKQPVAGITIFGLHCDTTGGTEYAADFPFFLNETLMAKFGQSYLSIFAPGTCGNVNHFDLMGGRQAKGGNEAQRIGETLAATVLSNLSELRSIEEPRLEAISTTVNVPLQKYTPDEFANARGSLDKVGTNQMPMLDQVKAVKIIGIEELGMQSLPMDVQAFRLSSDVALVALPGELFAEFGLAIKEQSPFPTTFVVELANDYPGYIPTKRAFAEGSYEPTNSKLEPGGGEMLVEAAVGLLNKLH